MRTIRIPSIPKVLQSKGKGGLVLLPGHKRKFKLANSRLDWSGLGGDCLSTRELFLVLPLPPSINHQYATVNGRRVLASPGRHYKNAVARHLLTVLRESPHRTEFFEQLEKHALSLLLRFHFRTALRRDLDGGLKIAQDAICQAIDLNDNRITQIHLHKHLDPGRPRLECLLTITKPIKHHARSRKHFTMLHTTRPRTFSP